MRNLSALPAPRKLLVVVFEPLATPMFRLHLSPFSPVPPDESCQAFPSGSVIASRCSCSTELSVVSADSLPVTFESPQPVIPGARLSGMSAHTKSFSGLSSPKNPYVWYAQYLFVLQLAPSLLLQSTTPLGRKMKYMSLSPSGQPLAFSCLPTSPFRSD